MKTIINGVALCCALSLLCARAAFAHCDSMDGPVVKAAQHALSASDVAHALVWVKAKDEAEIRDAFAKTLQVRKLGKTAQDMADRWFFETLVRVHREGEGEPFTGLKPAGYYNEPAYIAADKALETGSYEPIKEIPEHVAHRLRELHEAAVRAKSFAPSDVAAGRAFVEKYTAYVHYIEQLHHIVHDSNTGHAAATSAPIRDRVSVRDRR